jgi:hypothetical protein
VGKESHYKRIRNIVSNYILATRVINEGSGISIDKPNVWDTLSMIEYMTLEEFKVEEKINGILQAELRKSTG